MLAELSLKKQDINYIARIPTRNPKADKAIIVSLNSRYIKEKFIVSARKTKKFNLSNIGFTTTSNFYVNDHLMPSNKILRSKAKALSKENTYKYIWVRHCKIIVKKSDISPTFFTKPKRIC